MHYYRTSTKFDVEISHLSGDPRHFKKGIFTVVVLRLEI